MSDLAAFDFGDEFGRTLGQLLHGAIEGGPIAGGDHFGEFVHEFKRARSKLFVDRAASGRQRQKRFAQISAISAAAEKSALLELRHRARDLGLVHMSVRAHRLAGHHAVLAEGDQDPPFRYSNTVTAVDAGERLRHQAGEDVEPVGQKVFELEQRRLNTRLVGRRGGVRRAVTDWTGVRHEPRPEAGAVGSSLDRCGEHWRKMASRATEPSSRRLQGRWCALRLRQHVVKNRPETMESDRRWFPTAAGWFDAAREARGIFRLRPSQTAWFGSPCQVFKKARLAGARPRNKKPAAEPRAGRLAQIW